LARPLKLGAQAVAVAGVLALLALLVWRVANAPGGGAAEALQKGKLVRAPNWTLPRLDGTGNVELASLRGKIVVINFWAPWCIPCKAEAPLFEAASKRYAKRGVVVVGVDVNDFAGDARRFVRRHGLTYTLVRDRSGRMLGPYGVALLPETFIVGRDGNLVGERVQGQLTGAELESSIRRALRS
jgi:cytochrome c biogenesis protein CcmG, thiol:disulfide interchange protein DsbE